MGKPMLNYDRVMAAASIFNSPAGYAIAADRITVGARVRGGRALFSEEKPFYGLAISLGTVTEEDGGVMSIEERLAFPQLIAAVQHQADRSRRAMLAWGRRGLRRPWAPASCGVGPGSAAARPDRGRQSRRPLPRPERSGAQRVWSQLQILGQPVVRRYSGGRDVDAGCGMLAAKEIR